MNTQTGTWAYGLWPLVVLNSAIFIIFAFSFFKPKSRRDWRTFGSFSAFVIALFVEMYGFPLTIYLLSGWLTRLVPGIDPYSHNAGHFWETILRTKGDPHLSPFHIASDALIFGGFILLAASWRVLFMAQRTKKLAVSGPYHYVRHPQYAGFILIMIGFLLQWPTIPTAVMFPILVTMYMRLSHREERDMVKDFGEEWTKYAQETPRWFPKVRARPNEPTVTHS
ncbi:MAG: isoprenylcysteine carboxylmethyltransferase family protein [Spirochaetia bacterium]|jgi:protein-S-isoprenylcysteine O-methyltransferase Ste14